jgi:hypothetical protein
MNSAATEHPSLTSLGQLHLEFHRVLLACGYLHVWGLDLEGVNDGEQEAA